MTRWTSFLRAWPRCPAPLVVAAALPGQRDLLQESIDSALSEARPALLAHLDRATSQPTRAGQIGLLCLAALHDGVEPGQRVLGAALARLLEFDSKSLQTYDLALRLLVLEAWPEAPGRLSVAKADLKQLLRHRSGGGFTYGSGGGGNQDLSNTQYAALGLRAAAGLGLQVERAVFQELVANLLEVQDNYGGFGYGGRRDRNSPTASMTVAGIAVLAICQQALDGRDKSTAHIEQRIKRGWQWMAQRDGAIGDPGSPWSYYFHYGLERAAILTDVDKVGKADWYRTGARMLVDEQLPSGGWREARREAAARRTDDGDPVTTAFAVLFLRRKFQKVVGPITPRTITVAMLGEQASEADIRACADALGRRGKSAMLEVLTALRSDTTPRRRAAAQALVAIAGDGFGFDPALGPDDGANRDALRKAELWYLKNR